MAALREVSDATFEQEVVRATTPTLVDFWAAWCAPCRMMTPILEKLADEQAGKLSVVAFDVQANPTVPVEYAITTLPTLILFVDGREVERITGYLPQVKLMERLAPYLA